MSEEAFPSYTGAQPLLQRAVAAVRQAAVVGMAVPVVARLRKVQPSLWFSIISFSGCLALAAILASWRISLTTPEVPDPARLLQVWRKPAGGMWPILFSFGELHHLQVVEGRIAELALYQPNTLIVGEGDGADRLRAMYVSDNYFKVIGLSEVDRAPLWRQAIPTVVVNPELCLRTASNGQCVGRTLLLNSKPFRVAAVVPSAFDGGIPGISVKVWVSRRFIVPLTGSRILGEDDAQFYGLLARLKRPVTPEDGTRAIRSAIASNSPGPAPLQVTVNSVSVPRPTLGGLVTYAAYITALICAVAFQSWMNALMIAALMVLRRTREFTTRMVCGASYRHFVVQIAAELFLPLLITTAVGVTIFAAAINASTHVDIGNLVGLSFIVEFRAFHTVLTILLLVTAAASFPLFLIAAMLTPRTPRAALGSTHQRRRATARYLLLATQVAVSAILATCAVLIVRGARELRSDKPGFRTDGILTAQIEPAMQGYDERSSNALYSAIERSLARRGQPAALATWVPGAAMIDRITGGDAAAGARSISVRTMSVSPGFFRVISLPVLAGRDFRPADDEHAPRVAVITAATAVSLFGSPAAAIGRSISVAETPLQVVGVTGDARLISAYEPTAPTVFQPLPQFYTGNAFIFTAAGGAPESAKRALVDAIRAADRRIGIFAVSFLDDVVRNGEQRQHVAVICAVAVGMMCVALACNGIFTMMSYAVTASARDIGIRLTVGARAIHLFRTVAGTCLIYAGVGIALAMAGIARYADTLMAAVPVMKRPDSAALLETSCAIAAVVLISALLPLRRVLGADIAALLREE